MVIKSPDKKLTWKEFKAFMEAHDVKDDDEIDRIDISWGGIDSLNINHDEEFGWSVFMYM